MAVYRVIIPYVESAPGTGGPGRPATQMRYTTVEVEADSDAMARRLAVSEFEEMAVLGPSGERPRVMERDIRVERAPVARRSAFDVLISELGTGVASAKLCGSLNAHNFQKLQEALDDLKERGVARLVLDLSSLTYVNSTGLSLFVAAGDLFDLRLAAVPVKIRHILKMIGLDKLFPTYAGVADAAKAPKGQSPA
jgi:anti-anti-sigma factor